MVDVDPELKKELTVRAEVSPHGDYSRPAPFKVFREKGKYMCIPRYFGIDRFGQCKNDTRPEPAPWSDSYNPISLRPGYQTECVSKGIEAGHGVLTLPCGYGKTVCALAIAAHFRVRTMIVVHKEFLADQWIERIHQFFGSDVKIGRVQGPVCDVENCDFVIALIQTMSQRDFDKGTFDTIGCLIVDEAHHICARAFSQFLFKLCPRHTYGLSATPDRKDGLTRLLYWFLGPQFYAIERTSNDAKVVNINYNGPFCEVLTTRFGKLNLSGMITDLTLIPERNNAIFDLLKSIDPCRHVLVLTDRREHARYMCHQTPDSALYIGGELCENPESKRFLFATYALAQEGLDIPILDTVVLATPKSDIKQAVGRILRGGSTNPPIVYDFIDHFGVFYGMMRKRRSTYLELSFTIDGEEKKADDVQKNKMNPIKFKL